MEEYALYRSRIAPVPADTPRPRWSVMIPTYNSGHYLHGTLSGVLAQDPGPAAMQIAVVDDCSTRDNPEAIVAELGRGRVEFYRQAENVGHVANFNTCLRHARGELVHLLHGDDGVRDGFYRTMERAFDAHPEIGNAFCRHIIMDERGHWQTISPLEQDESGVLGGWLEKIAVEQRLQTPSMVVRRAAYETLGGFDRRIRFYGEDWEMWVRLAVRYPVWYEVAPLAVYRVHTASLSGRSAATGAHIRDLRQVIEITRSYLPAPHTAALTRQASEICALAAIRRAGRLNLGNWPIALAQVREGVRCSHSPRVMKALAGFLLRTARRAAREALRPNGKQRP